MRVIYCGGLDWIPDAPDHLGIKQGFDRLKWEWHVVDPILNDPPGEWVAQEINRINPDLVIHGNTDSLGKVVCPHVDPTIKQVFWMLDYRTPEMLQPGEWEQWTVNAPYLDAVFISAKGHMDMWRDAFGVKVFFAPHACYIPPKGLIYNSKFEHEVLFIGVLHDHPPFSERTNLLFQIKERLDVPVTFVNEVDWDKRNQVWRDMNAYYHSSKIVLDISHFWENPGYCSGRYWYTATYGACAVTRRFPGCETFFPAGLKTYFETPDQAAKCIHDLLTADGLRNRIKLTVAEYAWRYHSYDLRFLQMVECLNGL